MVSRRLARILKLELEQARALLAAYPECPATILSYYANVLVKCEQDGGPHKIHRGQDSSGEERTW